MIPPIFNQLKDSVSWLAGHLLILVVEEPISKLEVAFTPVLNNRSSIQQVQEGILIPYFDALYQPLVFTMSVIELVGLVLNNNSPVILCVLNVSKHLVLSSAKLKSDWLFTLSIISYSSSMSRANFRKFYLLSVLVG